MLWSGDQSGPSTRLFRRTFHGEALPKQAVLRLFAESRYHIWINGIYLARGPILHHGHRLPVAGFDITSLMRVGDNVIAVLVHCTGCALHSNVPTGAPGLVAELTLTDSNDQSHALATDTQWRVTDRTGWSTQVPRRGWAIGHVEIFRVSESPGPWTAIDFDDQSWATPDEYASALPVGGVYFADPIPALRHTWHAATRVLSFYQTSEPPPTIYPDDSHGAYAEKMMGQSRTSTQAASVQLIHGRDGQQFQVNGLSQNVGAVLNLDLGAEYAGCIGLNCLCPSDGVIDVGWSEYIDGDRPRILQKGTSYVDRVYAQSGSLNWQPIQFTAARYLSLWFREFTGDLIIKTAGMRVSEPHVNWTGRFDCDDAELNAIWKLCVHTQTVGTQEGLMDCPTREQACYVGDGHPVARWMYQLTGDARHWRYLVREQFARQAKNGLIRSTVFSGRDDTLLDYTLLAIMHTHAYWQCTDDADAVRDLLPQCHQILGWFDRHLNDDGLMAWAWQPPSPDRVWENVYDPDRPHIDHGLNLFIDHPGLGWHNVGQPGIDRRGINAGIHCLLIQARECLAELEHALGSHATAQQLRTQAQSMRDIARHTFYNSTRECFVDGVLDGRPLAQVSQHTNTWALQAGLLDPVAAQKLMHRMVNEPDADIARAGPYFWLYILPTMAKLGQHKLALALVRSLWSGMVNRNATTLWETFSGDDHDSACHPWSAAPIEFFLTAIAGLPAFALPGVQVELRPRVDLLDRVDARIETAAGPIEIKWSTTVSGIALAGKLPVGISAKLIDPNGQIHSALQGDWSLAL